LILTFGVPVKLGTALGPFYEGFPNFLLDKLHLGERRARRSA
jgi:hypothetical protein